MIEESAIKLTDRVLSKSHRLLTQDEILRRVRRQAGQIYRRIDPETGDGTNEYHLVGEDVAIVVKSEGGDLVVVTQMHPHPSYTVDDSYRAVREVPED